MRKVFAVAAGLMVLSTVFMAACSDDEPSEEEATSSYCSDLEALSDALAAYADLGVDSTIDEVEAAQEDVSDAFAAVQESSSDVVDARLDDLESAYDDLASQVNDISGEDTVGEAITSIAAAAQQVEAARADLVSSADC